MLAVLQWDEVQSSKDSLECERRVKSLLFKMCLYDTDDDGYTIICYMLHGRISNQWWLICRMNDLWWSPFSWNCANVNSCKRILLDSTGCNTTMCQREMNIWYVLQLNILRNMVKWRLPSMLYNWATSIHKMMAAYDAKLKYTNNTGLYPDCIVKLWDIWK